MPIVDRVIHSQVETTYGVHRGVHRMWVDREDVDPRTDKVVPFDALDRATQEDIKASHPEEFGGKPAKAPARKPAKQAPAAAAASEVKSGGVSNRKKHPYIPPKESIDDESEDVEFGTIDEGDDDDEDEDDGA